MSDQGNKEEPSVSAGMTIPPLPKSGLLNRLQGGVLLALARAFVNVSITRGDSDSFFISNRKVIIQLKRSVSGSAPPANPTLRFKIKGDTLDGGGNPLAGNPIMAGNSFTCRTWDGTTLGAIDTPVAKNWLLRNSITTRGADGTTWNYSYVSFVQRTATASGRDVETQYVDPHYNAGDEIYATDMSNTSTDLTGEKGTGVTGCKYLDDNRDGRCWCSIPVNPAP